MTSPKPSEGVKVLVEEAEAYHGRPAYLKNAAEADLIRRLADELERLSATLDSATTTQTEGEHWHARLEAAAALSKGHGAQTTVWCLDLTEALVALSRLEAARAKLDAARSLMITMGVWTNAAGYTTDAALWIERAMGDLSADPR